MEIPQGNSREDNKARKQIIKDFYASWIAEHPDKKVWNKALRAFIYVKYASINETVGRASVSYDSTKAIFDLTTILTNAKLKRRMPPKTDDANQKSFSEMLILKHGNATLVVGKRRTSGEYVQYCITGQKK